MEDHDQQFKVLLRKFFEDFMRLFFPVWANRFDFTQVEWLDKELFPDPPKGEHGAVDLLAKVATREPVRLNERAVDHWLLLIHIEVEAEDSVNPLRRRMARYYRFLRDEHELPVLPIALYLRVGLDGVGWDVYEETLWDESLLRFRYPYIGLPALDGERYLHQENLLGVALSVLMRLPKERRLELASEAWQHVVKSGKERRDIYLLCSCIETYVAPDAEKRHEFRQRAYQASEPGVKAMVLTRLGGLPFLQARGLR